MRLIQRWHQVQGRIASKQSRTRTYLLLFDHVAKQQQHGDALAHRPTRTHAGSRADSRPELATEPPNKLRKFISAGWEAADDQKATPREIIRIRKSRHETAGHSLPHAHNLRDLDQQIASTEILHIWKPRHRALVHTPTYAHDPRYCTRILETRRTRRRHPWPPGQPCRGDSEAAMARRYSITRRRCANKRRPRPTSTTT